MVNYSDMIINIVLLVSAGLMIRFLLQLRQKNMMVNSGHYDEDYTGGAKNPESFLEPDDDALEEMQELLDNAAD